VPMCLCDGVAPVSCFGVEASKRCGGYLNGKGFFLVSTQCFTKCCIVAEELWNYRKGH
jgi:hypothetical protein